MKTHPLVWMISISALIFFVGSSVRHALFQSGAFDLGFFDQLVYLISQGQPPISSILGFHLLGDHAAWAIYPLGLLYKLYPDVHWLFAVQAVALALGAWPTWRLARQAGLSEGQAIAMAVVYLLYPLVFNITLFDFHPEVMALPALLGAILAARLNQLWWFSLAIVFVLGCKAALSLTVASMGIWLLVFEKKRRCGAIALILGISWFLIASKVIIPLFSGREPAALHRYSYLGNSISEIMKNLLLKPGLVLDRINVQNSLTYLAKLVFPVIWGLSPQHLAALISTVPVLVLNILSDVPYQRSLQHQYSMPVLPFLLVAVISTLAAGQGWLRNRRTIILWSLLAFFALAKYSYFWSTYLESLDTSQATREAIAQITTKGGVLTTHDIAPHLTHRSIVKLAYAVTPTADVAAAASTDLSKIDYILLNVRHPGWLSTPEFATSLVEQFKKDESFQLHYQRDDVYLFLRGNREQDKRDKENF
ncbi:MAG TPA: DUF2079 domain-containing protein [Coleofasciculaceae cyanobacterium]|jgi:uncharacterized membrane protein